MHNSSIQCPFCGIDPSRVQDENEYAIAFRDGYPIAEGHTLVSPKRHVMSLFDTTAVEEAAVWDLVRKVRRQLMEQVSAEGFTIGVNDGVAAGQTVTHAHVHIIPRWIGDVPDPRGGIRWVIPQKAPYWDTR